MNNRLRAVLWMIALGMLAASGCAGPWLSRPRPETVGDDQLVIVTVKAQDTLQSLAQHYLGDFRKANWIAQFNRIQGLHSGMRLVIPLAPANPGGLHPRGYQTLPVLLYPQIVADGGNPRALSAGEFERHLQYLYGNGYRTISLDRMADFLNLADQLPVNAFVITFDTADRWVHDLAFPALARYGYTAAVFIPTADIGQAGKMTWTELAEMTAAGFDIGTSGTRAEKLTRVPPGTDTQTYLDHLEAQIREPQTAIAQNLKTDCRYFAYPDGDTNDLIIALLKKHGYRLAFTRRRGGNPFFVDNYKVHRARLAADGQATQLRQNLTTFVPAELR